MASEILPVSDLSSLFELHDDDGYMWLKGNFHTHTTNSDGRGHHFVCLNIHEDMGSGGMAPRRGLIRLI